MPPVSLRQRLTQALPFVTGLWVLVELLSLRLGLLNRFFFDTLHAETQGIDYFSLPKAWLNLQAGRSLYGTFDPPAYGPHFTWYLAHPAFAVVVGWPLSQLAPMDSYGVFTLLSLALMACCAALFAHESRQPLVRAIVWLLMLGAFPTFLMLWVGNVQAFTVLGLSLLLVGIQRQTAYRVDAPWLMRAGLLLSLFTKPVVLLVLPLLLLVKETRRSAFDAVAVYLPISVLFQVVPGLNPERISLGRIFWLSWHPGVVRATMNIYANGLRLTPDMRDNSIHWFNLIAQSSYRLQHIDVYSLPVFLDGVLGVRTPDWLYALPTLLVVVLSFAVGRIGDRLLRLRATAWLVMAASLDFFLAYPNAWEYQYTAVLPVAAMLLINGPSAPEPSLTKPYQPALPRPVWLVSVALACCAWLPSLYFLSGTATPGTGVLFLARLDRVLPVTLLFVLLVWQVSRAALPRRATA